MAVRNSCANGRVLLQARLLLAPMRI